MSEHLQDEGAEAKHEPSYTYKASSWWPEKKTRVAHDRSVANNPRATVVHNTRGSSGNYTYNYCLYASEHNKHFGSCPINNPIMFCLFGVVIYSRVEGSTPEGMRDYRIIDRSRFWYVNVSFGSVLLTISGVFAVTKISCRTRSIIRASWAINITETFHK